MKRGSRDTPMESGKFGKKDDSNYREDMDRRRKIDEKESTSDLGESMNENMD